MPTKTPLPLPASPGPERIEADVEVVEDGEVTGDKRRDDLRAAVELGTGLFTVLVRGLRRPRPPQ